MQSRPKGSGLTIMTTQSHDQEVLGQELERGALTNRMPARWFILDPPIRFNKEL
jgi:hypothetical protein